MNCPWCGKELQTGHLIINAQSSSFANPLWKTDDEKFGLMDRMLQMDGKPVYGLDVTGMMRKKIRGYHCPDCRQFIFDGWTE